jgi:hypothetical protein
MIWFIIGVMISVGVFAFYEKRQQKIEQRKMDEEIRKAKEQQQNQPKDYEVDLPNPATVSIYRIADFLQKEYRIAVLEKYIEVAREYKADDQVITMIENRLAKVRQLLNEI